MDIIQELTITEVIKQLSDDGISTGEIKVLIEDHVGHVLAELEKTNE